MAAAAAVTLARRLLRSGPRAGLRGAGGREPGAAPRRAIGHGRVAVELDGSTGVAVMKMENPPVNSLSLDFLTEFVISLEKLENDRSCRGVILTSGAPKIFSAGLDIMEMYGKSTEHYAEFWRAVQEMWLRLYQSNLVTIAAINAISVYWLDTRFDLSTKELLALAGALDFLRLKGSSPAGGCLMAMSCDYRILADNPKYSIGLNETQLGIVAPFWFKDTMVNTIGNRATERSLQLGLLYSPAEAHRIGLVDQLVPEEKIQNMAAAVMSQWLAIPDHARQITKSMMRKPTVDRLLAHRESDIQNFVSFISKDSIQKSLRMYMEMLKQRRG